jgi:ubiquinone/menaquinone biosynthesis C-methylase UbiE
MSTVDQTPPPTPDPAVLKQVQQYIWSQGEYNELSPQHAPAVAALLDALDPQPAATFLDVAAGDGMLAAAAARRGLVVGACDITPRMVELGRARCARDGLAVDWREADAEELPFADASFDHAGSTFGAMFAPDPDRAASELARVVRPGGGVGLTSWTPGSFVGRLAETIAARLPIPPSTAPVAHLWGDPELARARLEPYADDITTKLGTLPMRADSPEAMLAFFERVNGPLIAARTLVRDDYPELQAAVLELMTEHAEPADGGIEIAAEYLLITARSHG